MPGTVHLMYHELEVAGRKTARADPGYLRYVLALSSFEQQMRWLKHTGLRGVSVGEALDSPGDSSVVLTFDDGCESDLAMAAPILKELKFSATFYITVGFIDKPGYLSAAQVRDLSHLGFELGCHSMTHPNLSEVHANQLSEEVALAKIRLQQIAECRVDHFSCPGGRYDWRVVRLARDAGYRSLATSRIGTNRCGDDRFRLARIPVMRNTSLKMFQRWCRGRGLWSLQLGDATREAARKILGDSRYDHLRAGLLKRRRGVALP